MVCHNNNASMCYELLLFVWLFILVYGKGQIYTGLLLFVVSLPNPIWTRLCHPSHSSHSPFRLESWETSPYTWHCVTSDHLVCWVDVTCVGVTSTHTHTHTHTAGTRERNIPYPSGNPFTILFELVSCPNYTYEVHLELSYLLWVHSLWLLFLICRHCCGWDFLSWRNLYQVGYWCAVIRIIKA